MNKMCPCHLRTPGTVGLMDTPPTNKRIARVITVTLRHGFSTITEQEPLTAILTTRAEANYEASGLN